MDPLVNTPRQQELTAMKTRQSPVEILASRKMPSPLLMRVAAWVQKCTPRPAEHVFGAAMASIMFVVIIMMCLSSSLGESTASGITVWWAISSLALALAYMIARQVFWRWLPIDTDAISEAASIANRPGCDDWAKAVAQWLSSGPMVRADVLLLRKAKEAEIEIIMRRQRVEKQNASMSELLSGAVGAHYQRNMLAKETPPAPGGHATTRF